MWQTFPNSVAENEHLFLTHRSVGGLALGGPTEAGSVAQTLQTAGGTQISFMYVSFFLGHRLPKERSSCDGPLECTRQATLSTLKAAAELTYIGQSESSPKPINRPRRNKWPKLPQGSVPDHLSENGEGGGAA